MKYFNIALLISLFCVSSALPQMFTPDERIILELQDSRTLGENNSLLNYLNSDNEAIVKRTLIALANIQDSSACEEIGIILLTNPSSEIRKLAAFALGQIPSYASEMFLIQSLQDEKNINVLSEGKNKSPAANLLRG